jgi:flavin reductase (DIM6/NTAB) family NADH-FMN oxidoreductase RutF
VLAALGCEVHDTPEGGDHIIVLGKIIALHHGVGPLNPLVYYKSRYRNLSSDEGREAPARLDMLDSGPQMFYDPW